jgi:hypothetical protein
MKLFSEPTSYYSAFLIRCTEFIGEFPDRAALNILDDLARMKELIEQSASRETRHLLEPLKCRLARYLLDEEPYEDQDIIQCSSYVGKNGEPIELAEFLNSWIGPLIGFFRGKASLHFDQLYVAYANAENAQALVNFSERLKALDTLRRIEIGFRTISELRTALQIDLACISSHCELSITVESFSAGDLEILAEVLARNAEIYTLKLPNEFFSLTKSIQTAVEALKTVDYPKVLILL